VSRGRDPIEVRNGDVKHVPRLLTGERICTSGLTNQTVLTVSEDGQTLM
jgi:hypothetical protein